MKPGANNERVYRMAFARVDPSVPVTRIFRTTILLAVALSGCSAPGVGEDPAGVQCFFIETEGFGMDLNSCFANSMYGKWSNAGFQLKDSVNDFPPDDASEKHVFMDLEELERTLDPVNSGVLSIFLKGDLSPEGTSLSIQRFRLNGDHERERIASFPDLKLVDRANDFISPGQLDVDELCEQIVQAAITASYSCSIRSA